MRQPGFTFCCTTVDINFTVVKIISTRWFLIHSVNCYLATNINICCQCSCWKHGNYHTQQHEQRKELLLHLLHKKNLHIQIYRLKMALYSQWKVTSDQWSEWKACSTNSLQKLQKLAFHLSFHIKLYFPSKRTYHYTLYILCQKT